MIRTKQKKYLLFAIIAFLLFSLTCLTGCTTSNQTLFEYGAEMCVLMEDMLKNEQINEYKNLSPIFGNEIDLTKYLANDYDTPTAVYEITIPDTKTFLEATYPGTNDQLNNFPDYYKNMIYENYDIALKQNDIIFAETTTTNDRNVCTAYYLIQNFEGNIDNQIAYLYTFETGAPIFITFQQINEKIKTTAMFLPSEGVNSLSAAREVFDKYGCSVEKTNFV